MVKDDVKKIDQGKKGKERKFQLFFIIFVCIYDVCPSPDPRATAHMWRSKDNFREFSPSIWVLETEWVIRPVQQMPLTTDPSPQPRVSVLNTWSVYSTRSLGDGFVN